MLDTDLVWTVPTLQFLFRKVFRSHYKNQLMLLSPQKTQRTENVFAKTKQLLKNSCIYCHLMVVLK